jgi:hypothetical protein
MGTTDKAMYVANILQVVPTLGAPLMGFFGYESAGVDKVFSLINNVANALQTGGGLSSVFKMIMKTVKK